MDNTTPTVGCPVKDKACHPSLSTLPIPGFSKSWLQLLGVIKGSQFGEKKAFISAKKAAQEGRSGGRVVKSGHVRLGWWQERWGMS